MLLSSLNVSKDLELKEIFLSSLSETSSKYMGFIKSIFLWIMGPWDPPYGSAVI